MASHATSIYLPTLEVPHAREGIGQELKTIEVVRELEKQQWMLRAQLGEHM